MVAIKLIYRIVFVDEISKNITLKNELKVTKNL